MTEDEMVTVAERNAPTGSRWVRAGDAGSADASSVRLTVPASLWSAYQAAATLLAEAEAAIDLYAEAVHEEHEWSLLQNDPR